MAYLVSILAILAGGIGILGSILPGLPGLPVSWIGLLMLYIWGPEEMSLSTLVVWGIVTAVITVIDYWIPMYFTKKTGGSKHAERGSMIGMIVGIFLTPIGMILGAFLGALIGEMVWANKAFGPAFKVAVGSFIGFMLGTGIKVIASVILLWRIILFSF
jgi:uncharacterized protein YqgC (DUF456 family)